MSSNSSHHRRTIRLPEYDYSSPGAYFVTLVTYQRESLFGEVVEGKVRLTAAGEAVLEIWKSLPNRYPQIELDESVIMPNHFHGILWINKSVGAIHELPLPVDELPLPVDELPLPLLDKNRSSRRRMLLPLVIGYFKMNSSKWISQILGSQGAPVWQRNYYEHIIRNEGELSRIRHYIRLNPIQWKIDQENPIHNQE